MKFKCFFILLFIIGINSNIISQSRIEDLKKSLTTAKDLKQKVDLLNKISIEINETNPEDALVYANQLIKISKENNYKLGLAMGYGNLAMYYNCTGNYQQSIENYQLSEKIKIEINDESGLAVTYNNQSLVYTNMGKYEKAIELLQKSLIIKEKLKDIYNIAVIYNNIANLYISLNNTDKAIEYYQYSYDKVKELEAKEHKVKYQRSMAISKTNIGSVFYLNGKLDNALENFKIALNHFEKLEDKINIGVLNDNIGVIYFDKKDFVKAIEYHKKAIKILEKSSDTLKFSIVYRNLGNDMVALEQYSEAMDYYTKSLNVQLKIGAKDEISATCLEISKLYEKNKDFENALKYHKLYSNTKDSVYNAETQLIFNEIQTKYETTKKEEKIKNLLEETELKQKSIWSLTVVLIFSIILLLLLIIFSYKIYKKYLENKKLKEIIFKQKEEIQAKLNEFIKNEELQEQKKYSFSKLTETKIDELYEEVLKLLDETKIYLNSDLTLPILAKQIGIQTTELSQIINSKSKLNFNDFINNYRIQEAKKRLFDNKFNNLTIEAIGKSVGFNSKTTFIAVFKKTYSATPSVFKKNQTEKDFILN